MENNNNVCLFGKSKRRKIANDEESRNAVHESGVEIIIEEDNVGGDGADTKDSESDITIINIENDSEENIDVGLQGEEGRESLTSNYVSMIPITDLQEIDTCQRDNANEIKQNIEESIGWNCLLEEVGELEEKIMKRITSEISAMRKSWEHSSCKCKYEMNNELNKFTLERDQLMKENEFLMKENEKLKQKLEKEREFRLHLSGILKQDAWHPNDRNVASVTTISKMNEMRPENMMNEKSSSSQSNEISGVAKSTSPAIHEYNTKNFSGLEKNNNKLSELSIKDKIPGKIPLEYLADEIHERERRKCNIIIKGMIQKKRQAMLNDIRKLIMKRTRIWPKIKDSRIIESGLLLEMKSLRNKFHIMERKAALKSVNITLEDDLTSREHQVQDWLKEIAREDAKLGKHTDVGFFKIKQDGIWKVWSENLGKLVVDETRTATQGGCAVGKQA